MLDYFILLVVAGVVALSLSIYYMRKSGYDIHDRHKGAH